MLYAIVFVGAGIGGAIRHGVNTAVMATLGTAFPFGTAIINISGSFVMGLIAEYFALQGHLPQHARLFLTTGILGGFTTFSAFSLDTALLYERGRLDQAATYAVGSVVLSIVALFGGLFFVRTLVEMPS